MKPLSFFLIVLDLIVTYIIVRSHRVATIDAYAVATRKDGNDSSQGTLTTIGIDFGASVGYII